ncbi:hypothetical protein NF867_15775 [Solitalea sp. MAHUQ-68]|uniref:Uncharacterized protein n=1 Tax=Solitalea agri TaxID=2953739 RepID=A0A9X2F4U6_9SPHI|nr:hypothetical protein [Solitalea agri]MCO4294321.1 hypothetical protein [Solitalea agri]
MKICFSILLIFFSFHLYGQIEPQNDWPKSIQTKFKSIGLQKNDTVLVYYQELGPWTDLPDSCKSIPSVWVLWKVKGQYLAIELLCESLKTSNTKIISSKPFDCFINHIKDFQLKDKYLKKHKFLPPIPTDGSWEYLILITSNNLIHLNLSEHQRIDPIWRKFDWINPTLEAFDSTVKELYKKER